MAKVVKQVKGATVANVVDRTKLPATLDLVSIIRALAGCEKGDNVVEVERHTSDTSGSEVYSLTGSVPMSGFKLQVSVNATVSGTKNKSK